MTTAELIELLELKGWSRTRLAAELEIHPSTVERWLINEQVPGGPVSILLRIWLTEARSKPKGKEKVITA